MKKRYGFTLVELMIVMVILGVLVVSGVGSFISSQKKSRDTKRKGDLRQIAIALEAYYNDIGHYPFTSSSGYEIMGCGAGATNQCSWGSIFSNTTTSTIYMPQLPADPLTSRTYSYVSNLTGTKYQLYAKLENDQDTGPGALQSGYTGMSCGTGVTCTYGVSSQNTGLTPILNPSSP